MATHLFHEIRTLGPLVPALTDYCIIAASTGQAYKCTYDILTDQALEIVVNLSATFKTLEILGTLYFIEIKFGTLFSLQRSQTIVEPITNDITLASSTGEPSLNLHYESSDPDQDYITMTTSDWVGSGTYSPYADWYRDTDRVVSQGVELTTNPAGLNIGPRGRIWGVDDNKNCKIPFVHIETCRIDASTKDVPALGWYNLNLNRQNESSQTDGDMNVTTGDWWNRNTEGDFYVSGNQRLITVIGAIFLEPKYWAVNDYVGFGMSNSAVGNSGLIFPFSSATLSDYGGFSFNHTFRILGNTSGYFFIRNVNVLTFSIDITRSKIVFISGRDQ